MSRTTTETIVRLARLAGVIAVLLAAGTVAFALTEHENAWKAFVRTIDIVATTGSVPGADDTAGEAVKVVLTLLGVGTLFYALVTVTELLVSGDLGELLTERRMRKMAASLSDHYIVCGFGRVGRQVARDLTAAGVRYVVIDHEERNRDHVPVGVRFLLGRSSDEEVLRDAAIERARALVACVDSDAENIFITLTARELRPDLTIVARAGQEDAESKLKRAGADRVISPYKSSGHEMARLALHRNIFGVLDVAEDYRLEEIQVGPGSEGDGKTLGEVRGETLVVGIRRTDGSFVPEPPPDARLRAGDMVVAVGQADGLERLEGVFESAS